MRGFRIKPNLKKIDLQVLKPGQVEYFCTTQHIDKKRCEIAGVDWDQSLADSMEEKVKFYFLVKTNLEYDVISGLLMDKFLIQNELIHKEFISDKAKKCIDHYIKKLR